MTTLEVDLSEARAKFERMGECADRGHPYPSVVAVQYQPGRDVLVNCTNCGMPYERPATGKERSDYSDLFKLEFNI